MKLNLFAPKQPAFAMQLTGSSLKMMQLVERGGEVRLQGYAHAPLPKEAMSNDTITNADVLAGFIEKTLESPTYGHISTRRVALTLPESKSFVRVIELPRMADSEIDNAVLFEAESYVPMPMDQVYYDWKVLETTGETMSLLLVASPKEAVDTYSATLEKAGLQIVAIEVESQSLSRAMIPDESTETALLVDIDTVKTNLIMVEHGNLQFSSAIPIAGNTFTDTIAQALGVTKSQAEAIKKKTGISSTPEYPNIRTVLLPILKNLIEEIRNVIKFHYDHSDEKITKLVLSGGNAKDTSLVDYLAEELKDVGELKIELPNPWQNISNLQKDLPIDEVDSLRFTAVIGLADRLLE
jgi:type IV pilus assembly protein PilM